MKRLFAALAVVMMMAAGLPAFSAQFDWQKLVNAGQKVLGAATLTDEQMAAYVQQSVEYMDKQNVVAPESDPYTQRLRRLTAGLTDADGIPLNFKVYKTSDINAFACPDGSVRVYSGIMDLMTDDQLLGVIGHEIGHVAKRHSKKALKQELLAGAVLDGVSSAGARAQALTESNLSKLSTAFVGARFSQKQEKEADDYGYEFLKAHGRNPWSIVMSFERLQEVEGQSAASASYFQKMFSSHPDTKERIKRLTKRARRDGIPRPVM